jgi:hypothetical protein
MTLEASAKAADEQLGPVKAVLAATQTRTFESAALSCGWNTRTDATAIV